jgi:hypothetical protein
MNRRELIVGAGVVAAASAAVPAFGAIPQNVLSSRSYDDMFAELDAKIRLTHENMGAHCVDCKNISAEEQIKINRLLITRHPDLFNPDYHIDSPTFLYLKYDNGEPNRYAGVVKTYGFEASFSMEQLQDRKIALGHDLTEIAMVDELAKELRSVLPSDQQMVSYIPITQIRFVDIETFTPKIGFKTRYGLVPKGVKLFHSSDEERAYTVALVEKQNMYLRNHL